MCWINEVLEQSGKMYMELKRVDTSHDRMEKSATGFLSVSHRTFVMKNGTPRK